MSDDIKKIVILSGSVTSGYGLLENIPRWPALVEMSVPNFQIELYTEDNLSFQRAIEILDPTEVAGDILIAYFGTRVGWPRISKLMALMLPAKLGGITALDLPVRVRENQRKTFKNVVKKLIKRFIKQVAIRSYTYKPEKPIDELLKELQSFLQQAAEKFDIIYYLQHHHLEVDRLKSESRIYNAYYDQILKFAFEQTHLRVEVIELPVNFFKPTNFLHDNVHLSAEGHMKLSELLIKILLR